MSNGVVVTGMGMVTCLGSGVASNWDALVAGRSGIGPVTQFDPTDLESRIAGEAPEDYDPQTYIPVRERRRIARFQQLALIASAEALNQANLAPPYDDPFRCGVLVGSALAGFRMLETGERLFSRKGWRAAHPLFILRVISNLLTGLIAIEHGLKGPNYALAAGCASGSAAIGESFRLIKEGRADIMLAGGSDAPISLMTMASFEAIGVLSKRNDAPEKASRPFDRDRDGFVMSEGAGIVVLESEEHARGRSAAILGEVVGYGISSDSSEMLGPDPGGEPAYQCMKSALETSETELDVIGYVNAHGASSVKYDAIEAKAISRMFGNSDRPVAVGATKSLTGHTLGAAGAVESIYSLLALNNGIIPPTINADNPESVGDGNWIPTEAIETDTEYAMSNSYSLGGQNVSLILRRGED